MLPKERYIIEIDYSSAHCKYSLRIFIFCVAQYLTGSLFGIRHTAYCTGHITHKIERERLAYSHICTMVRFVSFTVALLAVSVSAAPTANTTIAPSQGGPTPSVPTTFSPTQTQHNGTNATARPATAKPSGHRMPARPPYDPPTATSPSASPPTNKSSANVESGSSLFFAAACSAILAAVVAMV